MKNVKKYIKNHCDIIIHLKVIALAKAGHKAVGVELNLWLVLWSRLLALYHKVDTKFYWKNLWKVHI